MNLGYVWNAVSSDYYPTCELTAASVNPPPNTVVPLFVESGT